MRSPQHRVLVLLRLLHQLLGLQTWQGHTIHRTTLHTQRSPVAWAATRLTRPSSSATRFFIVSMASDTGDSPAASGPAPSPEAPPSAPAPDFAASSVGSLGPNCSFCVSQKTSRHRFDPSGGSMASGGRGGSSGTSRGLDSLNFPCPSSEAPLKRLRNKSGLSNSERAGCAAPVLSRPLLRTAEGVAVRLARQIARMDIHSHDRRYKHMTGDKI